MSLKTYVRMNGIGSILPKKKRRVRKKVSRISINKNTLFNYQAFQTLGIKELKKKQTLPPESFGDGTRTLKPSL